MFKFKNKIYRHKFTYSNSRETLILNRCRNKKVLHIGACDAPYTQEKYKNASLLHGKIANVAKKVIGIDNDSEQIKFLNSKGFSIQYQDLNKQSKISFQPEVIIFGETIEHLTNFDAVFKALKSLMTKKTELIISTPNSYSLMYFVTNLFGYEFINPDHKTSFSMASLKQLLNFQGFLVKDCYFTHLEKNKNNDGLPFKVFRLLSRFFPTTADTILVSCYLKSWDTSLFLKKKKSEPKAKR